MITALREELRAASSHYLYSSTSNVRGQTLCCGGCWRVGGSISLTGHSALYVYRELSRFGFFAPSIIHHGCSKAKFSKHQASTFKVLYVHCLCTARYGFSGKS